MLSSMCVYLDQSVSGPSDHEVPFHGQSTHCPVVSHQTTTVHKSERERERERREREKRERERKEGEKEERVAVTLLYSKH